MLRKVRIYNTLSGKKEVLQPLQPDHVKMYACGVTVYDSCHIGHAMQAIFFDVIRNYLEYAGYQVTYVRNFTDVDDKIINRAAELGLSPKALADAMIESSRRDLAALGVAPASFEPKVSESIPAIIALITAIIEKGGAYATAAGDVYYRVRRKSDYGKLSNRQPDQMRSGTRAINQGEKEDELDFALWKHDRTPAASWPSPWGQGRPGWHIECSAMAKEYLGASFDLHGGGRDLIFPHHENEIAQSETANCCAYASMWMHSGLLTINQQKMSKSLGNFIAITSFLQDWPAEVLRLGYLQNHYRSNIDFSLDLFKKCRRRMLYYYETLKGLEQLAGKQPVANTPNLPLSIDLQSFAEEFHAQMSDDFNTVTAMATINQLMRQANQLLLQKVSAAGVYTAACTLHLLREWGQVLGLFKNNAAEFISNLKEQLLPDLGLSSSEIASLIAARAAARLEKDWAQSDQLRQELLQRGIVVQDTAEGTQWTIAELLEE